MKLTFSQGIVNHAFQTAGDSSSGQNFLIIQTGNDKVNLNAPTDQSFDLAYAHYDTHYFVSVQVDVGGGIESWGYGGAISSPISLDNNAPFVQGDGSGDNSDEFYLWIDVARDSGDVTYGWTAPLPTAGASPPNASSPQNRADNQHWYDTSVRTMKVWRATGIAPNYGSWTEVIRVFAAKYTLGSLTFTSLSANSPSFIGTQAGITGNFAVGSLIFDSVLPNDQGGTDRGNPLIRTTTNNQTVFFTTEDVFNTGLPTTASSRYETFLVQAIGQTPQSAYEMVRFSDFNDVVPLAAADQADNLWGMIEFDIGSSGDLTQVTMSGVVQNADWNWTQVNEQIFVDNLNPGQLIGEFDSNFSESVNGARHTLPDQEPVAVAIDTDAVLIRRPELALASNADSNDHGALAGLGDDDHPLYSLIDGTRAYTGKVSYDTHPNFTTDTEIVDKKYVDDSTPDALDDLIDVNIGLGSPAVGSPGGLVETDMLYYNGTAWVNKNRSVRWLNTWNPARTYNPWEMVRDGEWTMIANKETTERPAPQPDGDPSFTLADNPSWSNRVQTAVVASRHTYTFIDEGWIQELRIWVSEVSATTDYKIYLIDKTDPNAPVSRQISDPILVADQWTSVVLANDPITVGTVLEIMLLAVDKSGNSTFSGDWTRSTNSQNSCPGLDGLWNTNNQDNVIRIEKNESGSPADRTADLLSVLPNSTIRFTDQGDATVFSEYVVLDNPVDVGTCVSYEVALGDVGTGGEPDVLTLCSTLFTVPIPSGTEYVVFPNFWVKSSPNNPTWATVVGELEFDGIIQGGIGSPPVSPGSPGGSPNFTNDAFGIDLKFQPASVSEDWDYVASAVAGGGSGSGGGGGAGTATPAGSAGEIQFNDGGSPAQLAASPDLHWSGTTLTIGTGGSPSSNIVMGTSSQIFGDATATAAAPAFTFTGTTTGLFSATVTGSPSSALGFAANGSGAMTWDGTTLEVGIGGSPERDAIVAHGDIVMNSQMRGAAQTASDPTYSFTGDIDTGMFLPGPNILGFSTSGIARLHILADGVLRVTTGGSPQYELLIADDDDVPNKKYVDDLFAAIPAGGGANVAAGTDINLTVGAGSPPPSVINVDYPLDEATDGTAALPTYSFLNDTDTGMYLNAVGTLGFSAGGSGAMTFDGTTLEVGAGGGSPFGGSPITEGIAIIANGHIEVHSQVRGEDQGLAAPTYSFLKEQNTGWYRPDTQTVGLSIIGEEAIRVIKPGGSPGPNPGSPSLFPVDIGIDFRLLNDGNGDSSIRIETDALIKDSYLELIITTGSWKMTADGVNGTGDLVFSTTTAAGIFNVESTIECGVLGSPGTVDALRAFGDVEITGQTRAGDGSAALPAYSFTSEPDSGMFIATAAGSPGVVLSFSANGQGAMTWDGTTLEVGEGSPTGKTVIRTKGDVEVGGVIQANGDLQMALNTEINFTVAGSPDTKPLWTVGVGTPENVVSAPAGSLYTDVEGGAGTTLYVKESNFAGSPLSAASGWVAK